jgi:hypothetical protein
LRTLKKQKEESELDYQEADFFFKQFLRLEVTT